MSIDTTEFSNLFENSKIVEQLYKVAEPMSFKKGDLIHSSGSVCHHLYIITSGIARVFYYNEGKDVTVAIGKEKENITAIDSFIQQRSSKYNIEALENTEVLIISRLSLNKLFATNHHFEHLGRVFLEKILVALAERVDDLQILTSQERYEKLLAQNPALFQRVAAKHLASFLGMTAENFSRIRKKTVS